MVWKLDKNGPGMSQQTALSALYALCFYRSFICLLTLTVKSFPDLFNLQLMVILCDFVY